MWRGSTGGFGGLVKGRAALLNLGLQRPDLIDSGVLDWDVNRYGDDGGRLKEKMSFGEQACHPRLCLILVSSYAIPAAHKWHACTELMMGNQRKFYW